MFTNAKATITKRGDSIDDTTGYRTKETEPEVLIKDVPCVFSQRTAAKRAYADGMRDYVKPMYTMIIHGYSDLEIVSGVEAEITYAGKTETFTVSDAVFSPGISASHWECDLERIKTP